MLMNANEWSLQSRKLLVLVLMRGTEKGLQSERLRCQMAVLMSGGGSLAVSNACADE